MTNGMMKLLQVEEDILSIPVVLDSDREISQL